MILYVMSLAMFGFPMMFLNFDRSNDDELVASVSGHFFLDSILSQHVQSLNGFETENFTNSATALSTGISVVLFLLATLFTQVTMLNMLIALMGDTFERVTENRPLEATRTKVEYMAQFDFFLRAWNTDEERKQRFLFEITPKDTEESEGTDYWHGQVHRIDTNTKSIVNAAKNEIVKELKNKDVKTELSTCFNDVKQQIVEHINKTLSDHFNKADSEKKASQQTSQLLDDKADAKPEGEYLEKLDKNTEGVKHLIYKQDQTAKEVNELRQETAQLREEMASSSKKVDQLQQETTKEMA